MAAHKRHEAFYIRDERGGFNIDILKSLVRKTGNALSCRPHKSIAMLNMSGQAGAY